MTFSEQDSVQLVSTEVASPIQGKSSKPYWHQEVKSVPPTPPEVSSYLPGLLPCMTQSSWFHLTAPCALQCMSAVQVPSLRCRGASTMQGELSVPCWQREV